LQPIDLKFVQIRILKDVVVYFLGLGDSFCV
jgi:hypothetical protein